MAKAGFPFQGKLSTEPHTNRDDSSGARKMAEFAGFLLVALPLTGFGSSVAAASKDSVAGLPKRLSKGRKEFSCILNSTDISSGKGAWWFGCNLVTFNFAEAMDFSAVGEEFFRETMREYDFVMLCDV